MAKIIGIVGSRARDYHEDFQLVLSKFLALYEEGDWVCSGGCPTGGDNFAYRIHKRYKTPYLEFPANWDKYGKAAGFRRNTNIAEASTVLIACVAKNRLGGTEDTIRKFTKMKGEEGLYLV